MTVNIAVLKNIKRAVRYHDEQQRQHLDDYWLRQQGVASVGAWRGKLVGDLVGASGPVNAADLTRVMSRQGLGLRNADSHRATKALDITVSRPKDVDLLWALLPELRPALQAADDRAFEEFFARLEAACQTRVGKGGATLTPGKGLVAAIFQHYTARPVPGEVPDPNGHRHVVVTNVTKGPDGRFRTLDNTSLFRASATAEAAYMLALAGEMERLGFAVERRGAAFAIGGITDAVRDAFSPRKRQIDQAAGILASKRARNVAAHATRERKSDLPLPELLDAWKEKAARHGLTPEVLRSHRHKPAPGHVRPSRPGVEDLLSSAEESLDQKRNHFPRRQYLRQALIEAIGTGLGPGTVEQAADIRLEKKQHVLPLGEHKREMHYATTRTLAVEREVLENVSRQATQRIRGMGPDEQAVEKVLAQRPHLSDEQRLAVRTVVAAGNASLIVGLPGTGKSTTMEAVATSLRAGGYDQIYGLALSGIAAQNLAEKAGVTPFTLAKFLGLAGGKAPVGGVGSPAERKLSVLERVKESTGVELTQRTAIIVDEASQVSTRMLLELSSAALAAGSRVIYLGDPKQLSSPEVGGPFNHLCRDGSLPQAFLGRIVRQKDKGDAQAVRDVWEGEVDRAIRWYRERGQLEVVPGGREQAMRRLVELWGKEGVARPSENLLFTGLRDEAFALSRLAQEARREAGVLGRELFRNDRFAFHENDLIRFEANKRTLGVFNGTLATVEGVSARNHLVVRLEDGRKRHVALGRDYDPENIRLGYASTTHSGQGVSVKASYILAGGSMTNREQTLVQYSRGVDSTTIVLDRFEAGGKDLDNYRRQARRVEAQALAHTILEAEPQKAPAPEEKPRSAPARKPTLKTHRHRR